ncbi:hypothetical protein BLNAU_23943 [Blattamonas nauphoetae]|uniref:Uncharacterized protein n=1 Tax=Blattamonas nauphoetae TaxID=2049346 RepID=A0ABQ9WNS6_9EUKA|nr:hypothetical protein BLNAU_23943 [Blattamonas nauphoetae]
MFLLSILLTLPWLSALDIKPTPKQQQDIARIPPTFLFTRDPHQCLLKCESDSASCSSFVNKTCDQECRNSRKPAECILSCTTDELEDCHSERKACRDLCSLGRTEKCRDEVEKCFSSITEECRKDNKDDSSTCILSKLKTCTEPYSECLLTNQDTSDFSSSCSYDCKLKLDHCEDKGHTFCINECSQRLNKTNTENGPSSSNGTEMAECCMKCTVVQIQECLKPYSGCMKDCVEKADHEDECTETDKIYEIAREMFLPSYGADLKKETEASFNRAIDCDSECSSYFDVCVDQCQEKCDKVCSSSTEHSACVSCLTGCIQECVPEREDCLIQCESESIGNKGTNVCLNACKQNAEKCLTLSSTECIDECTHSQGESQDINQCLGVCMMGKASECGNHVSECDKLCLMKFGDHGNQTFSSFYSAAVQNATNTTRKDNTTSNTTHSSPIDAHFADMVRETEASLETCLGTCNNTFMTCQVSLDSFCTRKCGDVKEQSQKRPKIQSIPVNRPLQSRYGNAEDPQPEDEEMPEDEPVDSNCMSKCRLHNMPICIAEFQDCYFDCKDEYVKPSLSRLSDAKLRSPATNRTKEGKEDETEGLSARMVRLNDYEKVRKEAKERVRKGTADLKQKEDQHRQDGEKLKQQGEELQKQAEAIKQHREDIEHTSSEFRKRADSIKREAERHAANLKKEREEMWKTGNEEIDHAHEEGKEAISAAEAKAKELKQKARDAKKRMKARFNNLKKEEESVLSAAKDKLSQLEKEEKQALKRKGTPNSASATRVPTKNTPNKPIQPTNPNQPSPANISLSVLSDDLDDYMKGSDEGRCDARCATKKRKCEDNVLTGCLPASSEGLNDDDFGRIGNCVADGLEDCERALSNCSVECTVTLTTLSEISLVFSPRSQDATPSPLSFPTNLPPHAEQDEECLMQCEDEELDCILDCDSHSALSASIEDYIEAARNAQTGGEREDRVRFEGTKGKRLGMKMRAAQLARSPKQEIRGCVQNCEKTRQQCFSACTDKQKQVQGGFGFGVDEDEIEADFELSNIIVTRSESQTTQIKAQIPFDVLFSEDSSNHPSDSSDSTPHSTPIPHTPSPRPATKEPQRVLNHLEQCHRFRDTCFEGCMVRGDECVAKGSSRMDCAPVVRDCLTECDSNFDDCVSTEGLSGGFEGESCELMKNECDRRCERFSERCEARKVNGGKKEADAKKECAELKKDCLKDCEQQLEQCRKDEDHPSAMGQPEDPKSTQHATHGSDDQDKLKPRPDMFKEKKEKEEKKEKDEKKEEEERLERRKGFEPSKNDPPTPTNEKKEKDTDRYETAKKEKKEEKKEEDTHEAQLKKAQEERLKQQEERKREADKEAALRAKQNEQKEAEQKKQEAESKMRAEAEKKKQEAESKKNEEAKKAEEEKTKHEQIADDIKKEADKRRQELIKESSTQPHKIEKLRKEQLMEEKMHGAPQYANERIPTSRTVHRRNANSHQTELSAGLSGSDPSTHMRTPESVEECQQGIERCQQMCLREFSDDTSCKGECDSLYRDCVLSVAK